MKCLDDCHNYELENLAGNRKIGGPFQNLVFYRMDLDGSKDYGTTNEEILKVLIHRLKFLNEKWMNGKFMCRENSLAITKLEEALMWLNQRTQNRLSRNVEGTHQG